MGLFEVYEIMHGVVRKLAKGLENWQKIHSDKFESNPGWRGDGSLFKW